MSQNIQKKSKKVSCVWAYLFGISLLLNSLFVFGYQSIKDDSSTMIDVMISKPITSVLLLNLDGMGEWNRYKVHVEGSEMADPFVHEAEHLLETQQMLAAPIFMREKFLAYSAEQAQEHYEHHLENLKSLANFWEQLPQDKRTQFLRHQGRDNQPADRATFKSFVEQMRDDAVTRVTNLQQEYEAKNPAP